MKEYRLDNSPIVYYVSRREKAPWILFLHAAFVNHNMFKLQIDYFKDKYNILTLDIIGHGKSTKTQKGDSIEKMSEWINEILKKEKADIFLLALANHFTENTAFNIITSWDKLFSCCILTSKLFISYPPKHASDCTASGYLLAKS